jgi:hypothetical protein
MARRRKQKSSLQRRKKKDIALKNSKQEITTGRNPATVSGI